MDTPIGYINPGLLVLAIILLLALVVTIITAFVEDLPQFYRGYELNYYPGDQVGIYFHREYIDRAPNVKAAKALVDHWLIGQ